jgi:hypothetical protein
MLEHLSGAPLYRLLAILQKLEYLLSKKICKLQKKKFFNIGPWVEATTIEKQASVKDIYYWP